LACTLPHALRAAAQTAAIRTGRAPVPARSMFIIMAHWTHAAAGWFRPPASRASAHLTAAATPRSRREQTR